MFTLFHVHSPSNALKLRRFHHFSGGKRLTRGKIGKIVGLDPALPLFKYKDVDRRLAETDAAYVEVIHTCSGLLGMTKPIGSASFFPNGGRHQPGCKSALWDAGACSHRRASAYYIESIVRSQFYAIPCDSFEKFMAGNCSMENYVMMGGEPGNKRYVN